MMRVDVWQIGLTFRLLQATILGYLAYDIFEQHSWAAHEVPAGRVNAYGQKSARYTALASTTPAYCYNADNTLHNYIFNSIWSYESPACRTLNFEEVVQKSIGAVTITTSVIETTDLAWECDGAEAAAKEALCFELGVTGLING